MPLKRFLQRDVLINVGLVVLILVAMYIGIRVLGGDALDEKIRAAGIWAPVALVVAKASTIVIAPLGGAFLYPTAGALFGFWKALALMALGDALGGGIAFYLSRIFGRRVAERLLGSSVNLLSKTLLLMGTVRGFFIARLLLVPIQEVAAYAAGLTRLPFLPFILIHTGIGLPLTALGVGLGAVLHESSSALVFGIVFGVSGVLGLISLFFFTRFADQNPDPPASL